MFASSRSTLARSSSCATRNARSHRQLAHVPRALSYVRVLTLRVCPIQRPIAHPPSSSPRRNHPSFVIIIIHHHRRDRSRDHRSPPPSKHVSRDAPYSHNSSRLARTRSTRACPRETAPWSIDRSNRIDRRDSQCRVRQRTLPFAHELTRLARAFTSLRA